MSIQTLQEFINVSGLCNEPIIKKLPLDQNSPLEFYKDFSKQNKGSFIIETDEDDNYAYVGSEPILIIYALNGITFCRSANLIFSSKQKPFELLREFYGFLGPLRLVGFLSYEAAGIFEHLPQAVGEAEIPDMYFILHRNSFHFDYHNNLIIQHIFENIPFFTSINCCNATALQLPKVIDDSCFEEKVLSAQEYINAGDAFQIVLSRAFVYETVTKPFELYVALRESVKKSYCYLYDGYEFGVAGASPERLVKVANGFLEIMAIAGTKGNNGEFTEKQMEKELLNDPKEVAEHMMLVDLGRNDVGSIAKPGSIEILEMMKVRHYTHLAHIVSRIRGKLRNSSDALDALQATFPAGTLSGAPKIRAMEIIHSLEKMRRGLYGGAVVYIEGLDKLDTFIAIRTAFFKNGTVNVKAGAGIVYDSIPSKESAETRQKSKSVLEALKLIHEAQNVSHRR